MAFCARSQNTKFIFNSLLLTNCSDSSWLNPEIKLFNRYMFELSSSIPTLHYFNSDRLVAQCRLRSVYQPAGQRGNGIKMALGVRKLIIDELINSVGSVIGCRGERFRRHGWLNNVTTRGSWAG